MRQAVRAIVVKDDKLLVMHRNKFGQEYYTLIGGGIDFGESAEASLLREIREETGLIISNPKLVFTEDGGPVFGKQFVYHCQYVSGEPQLDPQSEEAKISALGQNLYKPMWLPIKDLPQTTFRSDKLKQRLIRALTEGFPAREEAL